MTTQQYMDEIYNRWHYIPTWPLGKERRLGDVGVFHEGVFERQRALDNFGIDFDARTDEDTAEYTYKSGSGVNIEVTLEGDSSRAFQAIGDAEAGARIEFEHEHAFVFVATDCLEHEIEDKAMVRHALLNQAGEDEAWLSDYAVVTDVVDAGSATVLIAGSTDAAIELRATGTVGSAGLSLADLSAGMEEAYAKNMALKAIGSENVTPLFRSTRFKKELWERVKDWFLGESDHSVTEDSRGSASMPPSGPRPPDDDTVEDSGDPEPRALGAPGSPVDNDAVDAMFKEVTPAEAMEPSA